LNKLSQFWQELKRRKVVRVIAVYAAAAFVILELTDIVAPSLGLPDWTLNFTIILICVGFIITVIVSWIYDIHPEGGIVKTQPAHKVKKDGIPSSSTSWKIASYISFVVIVGLIVLNIIPRINRSKEISSLEKSIAVLPFENWSVSEEHSHMGNAIANEIITELSKVQDFHVVSYTSSSRYNSSVNLSIPQIGKKLEVNFIIEGTVERQDDNVNIHVQVIQAENDDHIWANEFSGEWKDIFKIQDDIALEVADNLMTVLSDEEIVKIDKEPTENPVAYDYYLKGKSIFENDGDDSTEEAIIWFKKAIELDSSFALPWTYLSMCYWRQTSTSDTPEFQEAKKANERALKLDPTSGPAIVNMAEILDNEYDFIRAEEKIKLALETEPNNQYVLRNAGRFNTLLGRHNLGISYCKQALQDDPINRTALLYLVRAYFYACDFENAWKALKKSEDLGYDANAIIYYQMLLEQDLQDSIVNGPVYQDFNLAHTIGLAAAYMKSGNKMMAEKLMDEKLIGNLEGGSTISYNYRIAMVYAYGGETENACNWLERSFEAKERFLTHIAVDPAFKKLRNEPRLINIMQKMKFPNQE
jgi:adenylate cyclase